MMKIKINGKEHQLEHAISLSQIIEKMGGLREGMALARNQEVVCREEYSKIFIQDGDALEIIQAVGGG